MGTLITEVPLEVLENLCSGTDMRPEDARKAGISKLAFAGFYRNNRHELQELRDYADLSYWIVMPTPNVPLPFVAHMSTKKYTQVVLLHSLKIDSVDYFVFLSRSPRKLILASQDELLIETDEPTELFAKVDDILSEVRSDKLSQYTADRHDVAKYMLIRLASSFEESAKKKRASANRDDAAVVVLNGVLRRIGHDRAPLR